MPIIKNKKDLSTTPKRKIALDMIEAGLKAVDPKILLRNSFKYNADFNSIEIQNKIYDVLSGRLFVIGGGKASGAMAEELENIIGPKRITAGVVNVPEGNFKTKKIKTIKAGHPLPDINGVRGVKKMLDLKEKFKIGKKDLVICLISGGASAMISMPRVGITLSDNQKTTKLFLESGADINEVNTIRKHLSLVKGGQLAEFFKPAQVVSIIISDVVGNSPAVIGSGPTVNDPTTFKDAFAIAEKYDLFAKLPSKVSELLRRGAKGKERETPKNLTNAQNFIIGKNSLAMEAMAHCAKNYGLNPLIVSAEMIGRSIDAANIIAQDILKGEYKKFSCLLYGGETTPVLPENYGKGGRNQHLAAEMAVALKDNAPKDWVFASLASDGRDFLKGIAGAIVDGSTLRRAEAKDLDYKKYIENYDTATMFKKIGQSLIKTDETGTNVGDLVVYLQ